MTREHKIKRSDIRRQLGDRKLYIGVSGERMNFAQSANSDAFKFGSYTCNECNSSRTQLSDIAYDQFINAIECAGSSSEAFNSILEQGELSFGSLKYVSLARYFAKLLGNHIADSNYPIPNKLQRFVLKETSDCNFKYNGKPTTIGAEEVQSQTTSRLTHGGLVVILDPSETTPRRLHSCRIIGQFQISFQYTFDADERQALHRNHQEFCATTIAAAKSELTLKTTPEHWRELGIELDSGCN